MTSLLLSVILLRRVRNFHHLFAPRSDHRSFLAGGMVIIWVIALAKLLFHIYFNNRYGYFRDEFDYISCGNHLPGAMLTSLRSFPFSSTSIAPSWEIPCAAFASSRRWLRLFL